EVIFQRILEGLSCDTYSWVSYPTLCNRLMDKANGDATHSDEISNYEDADWLVVDSIQITKGNEGSKLFRASVLDKLFGERLENSLPSILVFQDDISKQDDLTSEFGVFINNIVNNRKSFHVVLSEEKE
ncbi:MAG: hypothetical protein WCO84_06265, partial [bacterium]